MAIYIIAPFALAIVILLLIKFFGSKHSTTTEEVHRKPRRPEYTWDVMFGLLFFAGASAMGASLPMSGLMLLVGIFVGHFVKGVVEELKKRKKHEQKQ